MDDQPTSIVNSLAHRIKNVRQNLGESQEEFGKRFDVQRLTVSGWEAGTPPKKHARELERFLKEQEATGESVSYQFPLPFNQTVSFECQVLPKGVDSVHFQVQIKRKAS